jgi:Pyridoxamine 5'-phosphate oxidase
MGKVYNAIDEKLSAWLSTQKLFFVGTAPLSQQGHVNCSPKDGRSFQILDERTVVYLDLTGSGVETIAHVKENGRIVLMFCAFSGAPNIVRLHGQGEVIESHHEDFLSLKARFGNVPGLRSFIRVRLTRVSTSCGFGVPLYEFLGDRNQLAAWAERKGPERLVEYRHEKNAISIDGLRGIAHPER